MLYGQKTSLKTQNQLISLLFSKFWLLIIAANNIPLLSS